MRHVREERSDYAYGFWSLGETKGRRSCLTGDELWKMLRKEKGAGGDGEKLWRRRESISYHSFWLCFMETVTMNSCRASQKFS